MNELNSDLGVLLWDLIWQSTLILLLGLLAARLFARHPARAHAVLLLAIVAALVAPLASQLVRLGNWGLLAPRPVVAQTVAKSSPKAIVHLGDTRPQLLQARISEESGDRPAMNSLDATPVATRAAVDAPAVPIEAASLPREGNVENGSLRAALLPAIVIAWAIVSLLAVVRLLAGVVASLRLVRAARDCNDAAPHAALDAARARLGVRREVALRNSAAVRCPVIWGWGRATVVVPAAALLHWTSERWTAVLCHELAHLKRRDHLATLVVELAGCLLPWQPLLWVAKRRLEAAAEQACDDWAIAAGHPAPDYAETLLELVAQPGPPLALAALRRPSTTATRIRHILSQAIPRPERGWAWCLGMLAVALVGVGATALCQRSLVSAEPAAPSKAPQQETKKPAQAKSTPTGTFVVPVTQPAVTASMSKSGPGMQAPGKAGSAGSQAGSSEDAKPRRFKLHGTVLKPDGQPMPEAIVVCEILPKLPNEEFNGQVFEPLARGVTDAEGKFSLEGELVPQNVVVARLVVRAAGFGVMGRSLDINKREEWEQPLQIQLEETYTIEGLIFTPDGAPAQDAEILVMSISRYEPQDSPERDKAWYLRASTDQVKSREFRDYWVQPVKADAEGRFSLPNAVPRSATAELIVAVKDHPDARIHVAHADSKRWEGNDWREPNFTLVLETPLTVEGKFVDEKTGKPLAGAKINVLPMMYSRGGNQADAVSTISDEQGHYRLMSREADMYSVTVTPPLGYPGLNQNFSNTQVRQLAGKTRNVKYNFRLRPGIVIRGRVIDESNGEGVPGAQVIYLPAKGRKLGLNNDFQAVTTTDDGSFEVTGVDGEGALIADAPGKGFYRRMDAASTEMSYPQSRYQFPHGKTEVNIAAGEESPPVEVLLRRGQPIVARVLDHEGQPVSEMNVAYLGQRADSFANGKSVRGSELRIDEVQPGYVHRVFVYAPKTQSGKVLELSTTVGDQPVEVRLDPCATIRGRYVYEGSVPAPEISNFTRFCFDPDHQAITTERDFLGNDIQFYGNFARQPHQSTNSNAEGYFEIAGIVPEVFIYLSTNYKLKGQADKQFLAVGKLKAGDVRDVGELVIEPR